MQTIITVSTAMHCFHSLKASDCTNFMLQGVRVNLMTHSTHNRSFLSVFPANLLAMVLTNQIYNTYPS